MTQRRDTPVRVADVYENTAQSGARCFTGHLGEAKLVLLTRKDAQDGEPTWSLFVTERPARNA